MAACNHSSKVMALPIASRKNLRRFADSVKGALVGEAAQGEGREGDQGEDAQSVAGPEEGDERGQLRVATEAAESDAQEPH